MTSSVTQFSSLININFPVPGVDNDTQGFRNNFARIKTALDTAGSEISSLQLNAIDLTKTNDFNNNVIKRVSLQNSSQVVNNLGIVNSTANIDYTLGSYQRLRLTGGSYNIVINNWPPEGQVGTIRLEFSPDTTDPVSINFVGASYVLTRTTLPVTYSQNTPFVWELWSPDGGDSVYAHEVGTTNSSITASNIVAYDSLSISNNKYTVRPQSSATVVSNNDYAQEIALLPHFVTATIVRYGCGDIDPSTSTHFLVSLDSEVQNIRKGSIFWFNASDVKYTVTDVIGNTVYVEPPFSVQPTFNTNAIGSVVRFINLRYNQPAVLHLKDVEPISTVGGKYDLKGQVYLDQNKMWVAFKDHEFGTNQWLKVATQTGRNIFTQVNTFTNITNFNAPIGLSTYTLDQANAIKSIAKPGTLIFIIGGGFDSPAYYYNNQWNKLCCGDGGQTPTGDIVSPLSASWSIGVGLSTVSPVTPFQINPGLVINNITPAWTVTA